MRRFHPTLVLAQREILNDLFLASPVFPSHIGSRSTEPVAMFEVVKYLFPSHIGSRSTKEPYRPTNRPQRFHPTLVLAQRWATRWKSGFQSVSIPLWFSLNE